jgi:plasmid stabilization system protein ParE
VSITSVIWTNEALNDLLDIEEYLGVGAESTVDKILARARQLGQHPESGAVQQTPSHRQKYRFLVEGRYKIIYSYQKGIIYIHAVFNSRRDPGSLKL